jgi:DNA-binding GntR family transcriptional regulator
LKELNIDSTPLSERIAGTIRDYILKGRIKQGERLTEPRLSKLLGISRTPIREALRILEMEGFVEIIPRRGAVVTDVTDKDVDEIFILKVKLESLAAKLAAEHLTDDDIAELEDLNARMEKFADAKNVSILIKLNSEFHNLIISKCENNRLTKFLEALLRQFKRATAYSFTEAGRIQRVIEEHREIIESFKKRDSEMAEELMAKHIQNGWQFIKSRVSAEVI